MRESHDGAGPVREPVVEGIFYPEKSTELENLIATLISKSPSVPADPGAIVTPHASLSYSGETMAAAFKRAAGLPRDLIVLVGPVHRDEESVIIVPESRTFRTPLGACRVDATLCAQLLEENATVVQDDIPHLEEHCIEVQLPFVQYLFPNATILPILLGSPTAPTVAALSQALHLIAEVANGSILFVISSNMTGYLEAQQAKDEASHLIELLLEARWRDILGEYQASTLSTHGVGCLAAFLSCASEYGEDRKMHRELLARQNSFAQNPDVQRVVEYASFAFFTRT
ncbi:MAG: AmmeMemoRadiSam system protein B [Spirochaetes bacterium]|jgi:AmmeMemoRadiSam system protein B|nr:AmmeMemoRadiSam system protein B [Spirochaetota bacterium]